VIFYQGCILELFLVSTNIIVGGHFPPQAIDHFFFGYHPQEASAKFGYKP
jgi:hypothetical protein